jgi:hypothetical protein
MAMLIGKKQANLHDTTLQLNSEMREIERETGSMMLSRYYLVYCYLARVVHYHLAPSSSV